jgi:hypothetical protein
MAREQTEAGFTGGSRMTIQRTTYSSPLEALVALIRSLVAYKQRYQMSAADFYTRYQRGETGDSTDVVEWAGDYQHYLQLKTEEVFARAENPRGGSCRLPTASHARHNPGEREER